MKNILLIIFLLLQSLCALTQSVTEVFYPKYVQGVGSGSPLNDARVPYVCRMTVNGLIPNATYRFFTGFIQNPASTAFGAIGAMILANQTGNFSRIAAPSVNVSGEYGEFSTNASGSYTGWFILEPSSDIIFTPGNQLYFRLNLNDGAGGVLVTNQLTAANPVTVINWGTTSGAALQGSVIYNAPNAALVPKNFVMLYDNIAGNGRPVSGTFIESDGTNNTTGEYYDLFYEVLVDGQANIWGTIIPNNLTNGINNISQYALSDGNFVNKCTSTNGVYGTTDTRNSSIGNDPNNFPFLVIDCTPTAGCNINASTTVTNVLCFGANTGAVDLTVTGATAPITYSWSSAASTEDLSAVSAGTYTVTITDGAGCSAATSATVTQPSQFTASSNAPPIATTGGSATITVSASGGTSPYTGTGAFTRTAGTYTFTVTDANGCTANTTITLNNPGCAIGLSTTQTNVSCNGGNNGSINLIVTDATAPITYSWSNGTTTEDISGLAAGTYTVIVSDATSCSASISATISQPAQLIASETHTAVSCFGGNSIVTISAAGGTSPYTGTGTFSRAAGTYNFTVTDVNGCSSEVSATITEPGELIASSTAPPIATTGGSTTVTVSATGGNPPYTGTGSFVRTDGTYTFTVTDANGCTASTMIYLTDPACPIELTAVESNVSCHGGNDGAIDLTVTGASGAVTYNWSNGAITEDISGLIAGIYTVNVSDATECLKTLTVTVTQPPILIAASTKGMILCNEGTTTVTVTASGGTAPYIGTGAFTVNAGAYNYTVTDANGCTSITSGTITQPPVLTASSTAGIISCNGGTTTVTVTASGGTPPYTGTGTFTAGVGAYSYTVTDANGCTSVTSGTVVQPTGLTAASSAGPIQCNGGTTTVAVTASGGTAPYTGTGNFTRGAGSYNFTVTDANGCISVTSIIITQPTVLTASSNSSNIPCIGTTTPVTVTAAGGTSPYTGIGVFNKTTGTYNFTVTDANGCTVVTSITLTEPVTSISASATAGVISECGGTTTVVVSAAGGTPPYDYPGVGSYIRGPGTYSFTVSDVNGCTATAQVTIEAPECLKVFPNPVSGTITVNHSKASAKAVIDVLTIIGQKLISKPVAPGSILTTIDLNRLATGPYLLVFYNDGEKKTIVIGKL